MAHRVSAKVKAAAKAARQNAANAAKVAQAGHAPQPRGPAGKAKTSKKIGGKTRPELANPALTRSVAKARTSVMKRESYRTARRVEAAYGQGQGQSLKEGILSMAMMTQPDEETRAKLEKMDPAKLAALYQGNKHVFEAYYSYNGINYVEGYGYVVDEEKLDDIDFFLGEYERVFGVIE